MGSHCDSQNLASSSVVNAAEARDAAMPDKVAAIAIKLANIVQDEVTHGTLLTHGYAAAHMSTRPWQLPYATGRAWKGTCPQPLDPYKDSIQTRISLVTTSLKLLQSLLSMPTGHHKGIPALCALTTASVKFAHKCCTDLAKVSLKLLQSLLSKPTGHRKGMPMLRALPITAVKFAHKCCTSLAIFGCKLFQSDCCFSQRYSKILCTVCGCCQTCPQVLYQSC